MINGSRKYREMLENPNQDPIEFLDEFKMNLFSSEIMVFTPKGNIITLPKGATALDFAYEIHTEVGNNAIGTKINYKLMPLPMCFRVAIRLKLLPVKNQNPTKNGSTLLLLAKAKSAIKQSIKAESKNNLEKGKREVNNKLKEIEFKAYFRTI